MGALEDVRKVIQDLVTPDLKALTVRVDSLEKTMGSRFSALEKTMDAKFSAIDARFSAMDDKFSAMEKTFDAKLEAVDTGSRLRDEAILVRLEGLANKMDANHQSLLYALNIDKRLEAIERDRQRELMAPAA